MALTAPMPTRASPLLHRLSARLDAPAMSAWTMAFALVTYLSLRGGGYDTVVRSEVGLAVWWIVLLGALAGILPTRVPRAGWLAIALLSAFAAWTGVAVGWSESRERTVIELGRVAAYLGVLVLAISLQGRTAARHTINGLACGLGVIIALAVISRLHPQSFPPNQDYQFLGTISARRLSYPLNYWNALAALAAIGIPLLLGVAVGARTIAGRAASAATLPLGGLCLYLTVSRGGVLALGAGLALCVLLVPRRLEALATLLVSGAGAAILVWATSKRGAVTSAVLGPAEIHQGAQLLWLAVIVCGGTALLQVAISLAARDLARPRRVRADRRWKAALALAVAATVVAAALAAGAPSRLDRAWHDFKQPAGVVVPPSETTVFGRLQAANGNGRYQFWLAALKAEATNPLGGIGPGTFEFWWARHATTNGFIRNAHSLYFETLGETGLVGLALLLGMLLWVAGVAARRALRGPPELRVWMGAAAGSFAAFLVSAAFEWIWQLAAIAGAALVLGSVILAGRPDGRTDEPNTARAHRASRAVVALLAVAALGAVLVPLGAELAIRQSQAAAAAGNLRVALEDSVAARRLEPWAATPRLQEALVLEAAGDLGRAATAARAAAKNGPTDWTTWLTLARIDARRGATVAAVAELRQAHRLNPRSPIFQTQ